jgi:hypothetical protein
MIEFSVGAIIGVALSVFLVRRYRLRDGITARLVRNTFGITQE